MAKYRMVRERLAATGTFAFQCADLADPAVIALAHDPAYVDRFMRGTLAPAVIRRIGFPWSEGLVKRTLASVGGTLEATGDAFVRGWGGNLAGGTHHAFRNEGSGFCVFNDIAVAIRWLLSTGRICRASVIDLDVHQGDGTAEIFENEPAVLTISLHGEKNFPFRKKLSKIDVALPDGTRDEDYLLALQQTLPAAFEFHPDVVFYQSGVDALESDTLGRLSLTIGGLAARDRIVFSACKSSGAPVVVTLGGGYSKPIERTAEAHANTFLTAAAILG